MWQKSPTSTTPVSILICASSYPLISPRPAPYLSPPDAYLVRLAHALGRERRVNNKVAVVGHDRPGLADGHAQRGARRAEPPQVREQLGVRERRDLDGDAARVLRVQR
jgi:hypothetical protein